MASNDTIISALNLINSEIARTMESAVNEMKEWNDKFQNGTKSSGAKARKKSSEWTKLVGQRIKEYREIKKLFSQYRKETIAESKK